MPAPAPRMHGLTHVPGGSDPIPGLVLAAGGSSYADYVLSLGSLVGYWRLGEAAEPWLDSSPAADAHLTKTAAGTAHITADVPGALPAGQDDGAVRFTGAAFTLSDRLTPAVTTRFEFTSSAYTVSCWVKLSSDSGSGASSLIAGTYSPSNGGWALEALGGPVIQHSRSGAGGGSTTAAAGPTVALGEWVLVVATWDPSTGHQLFYNGSLVDTDPGATVVPNFAMHVGAMATGGPVYGGLDGTVDELAIWSRVLTPAEITGLHQAGTGGGGGGGGITSIDDTTPSSLTGLLKGNGTDVDVAAAGTDYATPAQLSAKVDKDAVEAATNRLVQVKLAAADTQPAFKINGDGKLEWGPGGTAPLDVYLRREPAAGNLDANTGLRCVNLATNPGGPGQILLLQDGKLYFGPAQDTMIERTAANQLHTPGVIVVGGVGPAGNQAGLVITPNGLSARWVEVGAADSGGTGFRLLRIAN